MNPRRSLALIVAVTTTLSLLAPSAVSPAAAATTVTRIAGADRYDTAVQVVQRFFPSAVETVFVASGESHVDALAGVSAAGAQGAPVLLVPPDRLPSTQIRMELMRLDPETIVFLGGESAIPPNVEESVGDYAESTVRLAGSDRYETALAISRATFPGGAGTVYVAAGDRPADALSAGAVAAAGKMPLLLTPSSGISAGVHQELDRLNPVNIVVLGGAGVISDAMASELGQHASGGVVRFGGEDRYATSAEVSRLSLSSPRPTVVLASGVSVVDALAAGASAATVGAPVLLVQPTCMADSVRTELARLAPTDLVVVGGGTVVSDAAVGGAACPPPAPVRPPSPYAPPPPNSGEGRRVVYSNSGQRVWLVEA
ncbi:MAG: cell wall-binding repeat-containing protein, partial [Acidimicrobiia bacterium]